MPFRWRVGPYVIGFYSIDRSEPPHVHVKRDRNDAKFWLVPGVRLADDGGFSKRELRVIEEIIVEYRKEMLEYWHGYFK